MFVEAKKFADLSKLENIKFSRGWQEKSRKDLKLQGGKPLI